MSNLGFDMAIRQNITKEIQVIIVRLKEKKDCIINPTIGIHEYKTPIINMNSIYGFSYVMEFRLIRVRIILINMMRITYVYSCYVKKFSYVITLRITFVRVKKYG